MAARGSHTPASGGPRTPRPQDRPSRPGGAAGETRAPRAQRSARRGSAGSCGRARGPRWAQRLAGRGARERPREGGSPDPGSGRRPRSSQGNCASPLGERQGRGGARGPRGVIGRPGEDPLRTRAEWPLLIAVPPTLDSSPQPRGPRPSGFCDPRTPGLTGDHPGHVSGAGPGARSGTGPWVRVRGPRLPPARPPALLPRFPLRVLGRERDSESGRRDGSCSRPSVHGSRGARPRGPAQVSAVPARRGAETKAPEPPPLAPEGHSPALRSLLRDRGVPRGPRPGRAGPGFKRRLAGSPDSLHRLPGSGARGRRGWRRLLAGARRRRLKAAPRDGRAPRSRPRLPGLPARQGGPPSCLQMSLQLGSGLRSVPQTTVTAAARDLLFCAPSAGVSAVS
ncbi:uncharacterized protein LOC104651074 [Saimiri boliviensis]|uniref:uncharacterized protein LOC104651074 n=1 Tax=Saimiri boliviensis TaxID=27679 RepID=UPI003D7821F8